jgi:ribosomal protein L16 Arg81 hydroxylase
MTTLEALFGQPGARALLESYWPERHLAAHGPVARLPEALRSPELRSLDALAHVYRGQVAFGRGAADTRTFNSDAHAGQLYKLGFSVYLSDIAAVVPGGAAWVATLERALGVPAGCSKLGAFASPPGDGLPCHFDAEDVISVQLTGSKTFAVARVEDLPYPVGRQFGPGMLPGEELFPQARGGFPKPDKSKFERIRMEPGSVLFLPRGTWHETRAESDSFSISVGMRPPAALDYLLRQLRYLLLQDPQWRRPLYGAAHEDERRTAELARAAKLLERLPSMVGQLTATDLMPPGGAADVPTTPTARFQKVPMATLRLERAGTMLRLTVAAWDQDWAERTTLRTDVPGHLRDFLEWLAVAETAFCAAELRQRFATVPALDLAQALDLLSKAGFLRRLWFPILAR